MAKVKKGFRVSQDLEFSLTTIAKKKGISFSQLVELACYKLVGMNEKEVFSEEDLDYKNRPKKIKVSLNTDEKTYHELIKKVKDKNSTMSQEINFILRASLTNNSFSKVETKELNQSMNDLNKLGNLLKLSLNNKLNTPELLRDISLKIDTIDDKFNAIIITSNKRRITK